MSIAPLRIARPGQKRITRRMRLTEAVIDTLRPPAGETSVWVYDERVRSLALRVTNDARIFYWYGRAKGERRPVRFHIGDARYIPLIEARERVQAIASKAAAGENPHAARRAAAEVAKTSITVRQLWEEYRDQHLTPNGSPKSKIVDSCRYKLHLSAWANKPIDAINVENLNEFHRKLTASATGNTADKTIKLLRRMLTWKKIRPNPAAGGAVKFHGDDQRQRYLTLEELKALFVALDACESQIVADVIRLAIFTGARKGNVCSARWADIHLPVGLWVIPKDQSKNGRPMAINLMPEAVALLEQRRKIVPAECPWVFPGRREGQPITSPHKIWGEIREAAGIGGKDAVHFHDLRHTLASWMAMSGASLLQIGQQLGHASKQSTARYAHLEAAAARPATGAALAMMLKK